MIAVDTNVLVAAHRREHPWNDLALGHLREVAESQERWGLPVFCLGEFLRVVTHPRIFSPPTELEVALEFLDQLMKSPSLQVLLPSDRFWEHLRNISEAGSAKGNLIFDAQIAALCVDHEIEELLTGDRDFSRFSGLAVRFLSSESS